MKHKHKNKHKNSPEFFLNQLKSNFMAQIDRAFESSDSKIREEINAEIAQNPLGISPNVTVLIEKKKREVKKMIEDLNHELEIRCKSAIHSIEYYRHQYLDQNEIEQLNLELKKQSLDVIKENIENSYKNITQDSLENYNFQKIFQISDFNLFCSYKIGYNLFNAGKHSEAADIFFMLAAWNSRHIDYWIALGIAEKECQRFEKALRAYQVALTIDEQDPRLSLSEAECHILLNDKHNAKISLEKAVEKNRKLQDSSKWQNQIERMFNQYLNLK